MVRSPLGTAAASKAPTLAAYGTTGSASPWTKRSGIDG
jgi:hypothetical protein